MTYCFAPFKRIWCWDYNKPYKYYEEYILTINLEPSINSKIKKNSNRNWKAHFISFVLRTDRYFTWHIITGSFFVFVILPKTNINQCFIQMFRRNNEWRVYKFGRLLLRCLMWFTINDTKLELLLTDNDDNMFCCAKIQR